MHATRRDFLRLASLGLTGALAPAPYSTGSHAGPAAGGARSCILVYLLGGPSHLDMWDLKPAAPAEVRGPFKPIATTVPGIRIGEHLPRLAGQARRLCLLRSVGYPNNDHPFMIYYTLTGRVSPVPLGANTVLPPSRTDHPHLGAVVAKFRHRDRHLPGYVAIPEVQVRMQSTPVAGGGRAGFLGPAFDPLAINDDPKGSVSGLVAPADVTPARLDGRQRLLAVLEGRRPAGYDALRSSAVQLVRAGAGRGLFDLDREPAAVRERYGTHRFGRSLLLARRLVEAGVSLVAVHFNHMSKCDGWDTHASNFACLQGELLPLLDQGLSALVDDLAQRGRLDETLVVCMGEFGRTPIINKQAGRDHWGPCGSVLLAGGGVRGGRVVGSSDRHGAYPSESPLDPADVQATIYHALGLRPDREMRDPLDRPMPISTGKVIGQVF
jgi:hypothetical protein